MSNLYVVGEYSPSLPEFKSYVRIPQNYWDSFYGGYGKNNQPTLIEITATDSILDDDIIYSIKNNYRWDTANLISTWNQMLEVLNNISLFHFPTEDIRELMKVEMKEMIKEIERYFDAHFTKVEEDDEANLK